MSSSAETAASQWLEQLAAMRAAIAELKLPQTNGDSTNDGYKPSGDIDVDDDDLSPTSPLDDIWDLISEDDEEEYSEESLEPERSDVGGADVTSADVGSQEWLRKSCEGVASKGGGLDAQSLQEHISAVLASDSSDDELQMTLADVVGFGELDLVSDIILHRKQLLKAPVKPAS
ncbi:putative steryl acetyl hydrolase mug81, partial [Friedmanniomyces endolithicus]